MQVRPWSFECLVEWLKIREQEGRAFPKDVEAFVQELDHSALLQRLVSGKPALPVAPPLSFGYPWYDLLENGHGEPAEVYVGDKVANDIHGCRVIVINQAIWRIEEQVGDSDYIVSYDGHNARYLLHRVLASMTTVDKIGKNSEKTWRLERVTNKP